MFLQLLAISSLRANGFYLCRGCEQETWNLCLKFPPFTSDSGLFMPPTTLCAGDVNVQWTMVWFHIEKLPIQHDFPGVRQHKSLDVPVISHWNPESIAQLSRSLPSAKLGPTLPKCRIAVGEVSTPEFLGLGLVEVALGEVPRLPTGPFWGMKWKMRLS